MRSLVLCVCAVILASSNSTELKQQLKNAFNTHTLRDDLETCLNEVNISRDDFYREDEIMTNIHIEPTNEERTRNIGCFIVCVLKKQNLMEGGRIKEVDLHRMINVMHQNDRQQAMVHRIARKCLKKVRSITEECEKGFAIFACGMKAYHDTEQHGEHEREETEEETESAE